jgi:hypothetical protein
MLKARKENTLMSDTRIVEQKDPSPTTAPFVEAPRFSVTAHPDGAVLAVLSGNLVVLNLRLTAGASWALSRALHAAAMAQSALERGMPLRGTARRGS